MARLFEPNQNLKDFESTLRVAAMDAGKIGFDPTGVRAKQFWEKGLTIEEAIEECGLKRKPRIIFSFLKKKKMR